MQIKILPTKDEIGSGTTGFVSWKNEKFLEIINLLFAIKSYEMIDSIEITKEGITARIVTIN